LKQLSCEGRAVADHKVANSFQIFLESRNFSLRFTQVYLFLFFGLALGFF
jgi:hypothetical protein